MNLSHITLAQLRALVTLEETQSFTVAAQRLGRTQSAISHAVRQIEDAFGEVLFDRLKEGTVPNSTGKLAIAEARLAFAHLERLEFAIRGESALETGRLRLACFPSATHWILPEVIGAYSQRHPGIELEIFERADEACVTAVRERRVDLGMINAPYGDLMSIPLFDDELCIVAAHNSLPENPEAGLRSFADIPFIYPRGACEPLIDAAFQAAGVTPSIAASMTTNGPTLILSLLRARRSFTILPALALHDVSTNDLYIDAIRPRLLRRVALAAGSEHTLPPAARAFVDLLRDHQRQAGGPMTFTCSKEPTPLIAGAGEERNG
jgi:DNA-binding transcriptional LysR family regulator